MDGQAQAPDSGLSGLAEFLTEEPIETQEETQEEAEEIKDSEEEQPELEGTEEGEEESEPEEAESQQPRKLKVTVKGEDGADVEQEVDESELIAGYQRQADYTRKTQELAKRESEIVQVLKAKHEELRNTFVQQAETAKAVMLQLAGFKSPQEMYELAQNDPAAAVAERERQQIIGQMIGQVDQQIAQARQAQNHEIEAAKKQAQQQAWETLQKEKITKEGLQSIYEKAMSAGVKQDSLNYLYDPNIVLLMRDGLAYRDLKTKVPGVTQKAHDAPKVPQGKSPQVRSKKSVELEKRFSNRSAKLNDLAAWLSQ